MVKWHVDITGIPSFNQFVACTERLWERELEKFCKEHETTALSVIPCNIKFSTKPSQEKNYKLFGDLRTKRLHFQWHKHLSVGLNGTMAVTANS